MPIYRLLEKSVFDPVDITVMAAAFEAVCKELGLAERDDPLRDLVAKKIIECAETSERDPIRLQNCAKEALAA